MNTKRGSLTIALSVAAALLFAGGAAYGIQKYSYATIKKAALGSFEEGNYASALAAYNKLKDRDTDGAVEEKILETTALLVAEENFKKAKLAAAAGKWFGAKVLLEESEALKNPAFKYHEEAQALYKQAEGLVQTTEHKTASKINDLEKSAALEKTKRQSLEKSKSQLENQLDTKSKALESSKQLILESTKQLDASQQKILETEAKVKEEQAKAAAAAAAAEKEKLKKFLAELTAYKDMGLKGADQIENAVAELNQKRDVTALIYISQGKILFEEARAKAQALRATAGSHLARVDELIFALDRFVESAKYLRTSAAFIDEQSGAEFTNSFSKGKGSLADGRNALGSVAQFINSNQ